MSPDFELYQLAVEKHGLEALRPFITAVEEAERWEMVRRLVRDALVVLGPLCWLMAALPGAFGGRLRAFLLGLWAVVFALLLGSMAAVRMWRRRCERFRVGAGSGADMLAMWPGRTRGRPSTSR